MSRFVVTHQKSPNDEVIGTSTFSFTDSVLDVGCAYKAAHYLATELAGMGWYVAISEEFCVVDGTGGKL
jgi:hypothetical protein